MKLKYLALPACGLAALVCAAQNSQSFSYYSSDSSNTSQRTFLVAKDATHFSTSGDWHETERLRAYAKAHPGKYILFVQDGALHKLDSAAKVDEADKLAEPMRQLSEQQRALSAQQRPLGEQQAALGQQQGALGQQMRGTRTPGEMGQIGRTQGVIGHEQGIIGRAQGTIGRQQGVIGRQQGIEGKRYYESMQAMLDGCLKDGSCPVVTDAGA